LGQFAVLLLTIAFGFTMITYYRSPIPGIGVSFTQLLTDQPIYLARQLEATQVQRLSDRLNELYLSMEQPLFFNVSAIVGYFLVALAVTAARVVLLAVIAFGPRFHWRRRAGRPRLHPVLPCSAAGLALLGLVQSLLWHAFIGLHRHSSSCSAAF
jgi:hypothetical protein